MLHAHWIQMRTPLVCPLASVVKWISSRTFNPRVGGLNPSGGTDVSSIRARPSGRTRGSEPRDLGSIPGSGTTLCDNRRRLLPIPLLRRWSARPFETRKVPVQLRGVGLTPNMRAGGAGLPMERWANALQVQPLRSPAPPLARTCPCRTAASSPDSRPGDRGSIPRRDATSHASVAQW